MVAVERFFGLLDALARERVLVELLAHARAADDFGHLLALHERQYLIDHGKVQRELRRDRPRRRATAEIDRLDHEVEQH